MKRESKPLFWNFFSVLVLFTLMTWSNFSETEDKHCDPDIHPETGPQGYTLKSKLGYCDGQYRTDVSADFLLTGFMRGHLDQTGMRSLVLNHKSIQVQAQVSGKNAKKYDATVSATSVDPGVFYRLDRKIEHQVAVFEWFPPDSVSRKDIQVVSFIGVLVKRNTQLFFPIELKSTQGIQPPPVDNDYFTLLVETPTPLAAYSWELVDQKGKILSSDNQQRRVGRGESFYITLTMKPGEYKLHLVGDRSVDDEYLDKTFELIVP